MASHSASSRQALPLVIARHGMLQDQAGLRKDVQAPDNHSPARDS